MATKRSNRPIDKDEARLVVDTARSKIQAMFQSKGFKVGKVNCKYDTWSLTLTITLEKEGVSGETKYSEDFKRYQFEHQLPPNSLFQTFVDARGDVRKIMGYLPRNTKFPILLLNVTTGKEHKAELEWVRKYVEANDTN